MANKDEFLQKIKEGYSFKTDSVQIGTGMLNGEVVTGANVILPLKTMNRHGLIAGATGTGKTKTLQLISEYLSDNSVPVLLMDIKGDLSGIAAAGEVNNIKRFPKDFMFRLTLAEWQNIRSQVVTAQGSVSLRSQNVTALQNKRNTKVTPYAFTEQGVAMLSGILNSDKAINMNIAIMRAFVEVRRVLLQQTDLREQLKQIKDRIGEHDVQLTQIYDALENLLDEKAAQRKWDERERIGFKKK
jgi:Cdc6-like AAA superfamily ATPase